MTKESGLGAAFFVDGYDLSGDVGALSAIAGGLVGTQDVTGINKSAHERLGLLRDGRIEYTAFMNSSAGQAHPVLKTLPTADRIATYCHRTTLAAPAASVVAKQLNYDPTRAADGSLTIGVNKPASGYALEWGDLLTAGKRTDAGATNGTGVDFGTGSTMFGAQFYLHVFSFTGTDATVKIQESSDNGSGDAFTDVTGGAFTQITSAPTKERIATSSSQTVERYLRAVTVTTGGFSSLVFAVMAVRNDTSVVF